VTKSVCFQINVLVIVTVCYRFYIGRLFC